MTLGRLLLKATGSAPPSGDISGREVCNEDEPIWRIVRELKYGYKEECKNEN